MSDDRVLAKLDAVDRRIQRFEVRTAERLAKVETEVVALCKSVDTDAEQDKALENRVVQLELSEAEREGKAQDASKRAAVGAAAGATGLVAAVAKWIHALAGSATG